ncbi:MAG: cbb3-type cytochrome c oxidase subunit I [Legionellales bacterium]
MMSVPPVDFQIHNSLFLVAHFHNVIIGGVLFGYFAGIIYWFPKAFGFVLDETWGKRAFYCWIIGFYLAFMPLYVLGLDGFVRRNNHYANLMYQPYLIVAAIGALFILLGIAFQLIQVLVSVKNREALHDKTGDVWNGRTLEWSISSPPPVYNFATLPTVDSLDQFWVDKERRADAKHAPIQEIHYEAIHMPKNTPVGFIIAIFAGIGGFALIWHMLIPGIVALLGIIGTVIARTFSTDIDYYIDADTVKHTELAHLKELV